MISRICNPSIIEYTSAVPPKKILPFVYRSAGPIDRRSRAALVRLSTPSDVTSNPACHPLSVDLASRNKALPGNRADQLSRRGTLRNLVGRKQSPGDSWFNSARRESEPFPTTAMRWNAPFPTGPAIHSRREMSATKKMQCSEPSEEDYARSVMLDGEFLPRETDFCAMIHAIRYGSGDYGVHTYRSGITHGLNSLYVVVCQRSQVVRAIDTLRAFSQSKRTFLINSKRLVGIVTFIIFTGSFAP